MNTIIINNKYKILDKIGAGSFGAIYKGENIRTKEHVAIKIESIKSGTKMLKNESIIYQYLGTKPGIPTVKWFGKDSDNYYMILNLLGKSLQDVKNEEKRFSLKNTLTIGIQILYLLQFIHEKDLVHRDIKPENFLLGINNMNNQIFIIDFGFCKTYKNNGNHIKMNKTNSLIGSYTYASINSHKYIELSRRDDLESLGYMLIYFYMGKLDWQNINHSTKINEIINLKERICLNNSIPKVFLDYMSYVKSLKFEETPDYNTIINILQIELL